MIMTTRPNVLGRALAYVVDALNYAFPTAKANGGFFSDTLGQMAQVGGWQQTETTNIEEAQLLALTSAWAYSDIKLIADRATARAALPAVKQIVGEEAEDVGNHPFELLLSKPNALMSGSFMLRYLIYWYWLRGNAYAVLRTDAPGRGEIHEVWPIPANMVRPLPDSIRRSKLTGDAVIDYEYLVGGQRIPLPGENVVHFRLPNPYDFWQGLAPLSAAYKGLQIDHAQARWLRDFFRRDNAVPTALATLPPTISKSDFDVAVAKVREQIEQGMRILFTRSGDLTLQTLTQTLEQMQIVQGRQFTRDEIDRVFGVPQGLVSGGLSGDSRLAAEITFARNTVQPMIDYFAEVWTNKAMPYYGDDLVVEAPSVVPQDRALEAQEYTVYSLDRTVDENRAELGLEPTNLPFAQIPVRLLQYVTVLPVSGFQLPGQESESEEMPGGEGEGEDDEGEAGDMAGQAAPEHEADMQAGKAVAGNGHDPAAQLPEATAQLALKTELARWKKVALKEARAGRDPAQRAFESAVIPAGLHSQIAASLHMADEDGVKAVFAQVNGHGQPVQKQQPPQILAVANRFRRELIEREDGAVTEMFRAWEKAWQRIESEIERVAERVREAQQAGQVISPSVIRQMERYKALLEQIDTELSRLMPGVDDAVRLAQIDAMEKAIADAEGLVQAVLPLDDEAAARIIGNWNRLAVDAVEFQVGTLADGSPLHTLLDDISREMAQSLGDELAVGLAEGKNPRVVARAMRRHFDMGKFRAENIARTEMLRSYRAATLQSFKANGSLVKGWRWHAHLGDARVCAACLMMHGTLHSLDEDMTSHPQCRCAAVAELVPLSELGITTVEDFPPVAQEGDGLKWLQAQPDDVQKQVLGNAMWRAWRAGRVTPDQFLAWRRDPVWGDAPQPASLESILGAEARQFYAEGEAD